MSKGRLGSLDVQKLSPLPEPLRVTTILEELVHAWMHIHDEDLASLVVCYLYPEVRYENGKYWPKRSA